MISLQVECIKQIFELCMHIQHISDKADLIRSFNCTVKRLDITNQQHVGYIKYVQTFINTLLTHSVEGLLLRFPSAMIIYYRYHTLQYVIGINLYMKKAKKVTWILWIT